MSAIVSVSMQGLSDIQVITDILQKLATIAAIIVGAIWTYFNFFRGRTYRMRLEPAVSGKVVTINGLSHLVATVSLKNVGLSKVEVEQKGSGLQVRAYEAPVDVRSVRSAAWADVAAFPVFESHQWIEPGEMIEEQRLIVMPKNGRTAFQLRLRVVSRGISWTAMDTVALTEDNVSGREGGSND
jgi:hypothetical protein